MFPEILAFFPKYLRFFSKYFEKIVLNISLITLRFLQKILYFDNARVHIILFQYQHAVIQVGRCSTG